MVFVFRGWSLAEFLTWSFPSPDLCLFTGFQHFTLICTIQSPLGQKANRDLFIPPVSASAPVLGVKVKVIVYGLGLDLQQ